MKVERYLDVMEGMVDELNELIDAMLVFANESEGKLECNMDFGDEFKGRALLIERKLEDAANKIR